MFFRAHSYLSELATDLVLVFACHVGLVVGCLSLRVLCRISRFPRFLFRAVQYVIFHAVQILL